MRSHMGCRLLLWAGSIAICVAGAEFSRAQEAVGSEAPHIVAFFVVGNPQINIPSCGTAGTETTIEIMNDLPGKAHPMGAWWTSRGRC